MKSDKKIFNETMPSGPSIAKFAILGARFAIPVSQIRPVSQAVSLSLRVAWIGMRVAWIGMRVAWIGIACCCQPAGWTCNSLCFCLHLVFCGWLFLFFFHLVFCCQEHLRHNRSQTLSGSGLNQNGYGGCVCLHVSLSLCHLCSMMRSIFIVNYCVP